jgi:hypothetical protein
MIPILFVPPHTNYLEHKNIKTISFGVHEPAEGEFL